MICYFTSDKSMFPRQGSQHVRGFFLRQLMNHPLARPIDDMRVASALAPHQPLRMRRKNQQRPGSNGR